MMLSINQITALLNDIAAAPSLYRRLQRARRLRLRLVKELGLTRERPLTWPDGESVAGMTAMPLSTLSETQRVLVELAQKNRLLVKVNPKTKKIQGVRIRAAIVSERVPHEDDRTRVGAITVSMALALGLLKIGPQVGNTLQRVEVTPFGLERLAATLTPAAPEN